jgi:predicted dithiol-disulfide oxidoreductase (DUF899 family)
LVDYIGPLAHLHARDTSLALVSRAPLANLEAYQALTNTIQAKALQGSALVHQDLE